MHPNLVLLLVSLPDDLHVKIALVGRSCSLRRLTQGKKVGSAVSAVAKSSMGIESGHALDPPAACVFGAPLVEKSALPSQVHRVLRPPVFLILQVLPLVAIPVLILARSLMVNHLQRLGVL